MKKVATLLIALAVLGGGVAIISTSMSSGVFNLTIEQALADSATLEQREFKVAGNVLAGSIRKGSSSFEVSFAIGDAEGRRLECEYRGAVPDPFAEGREVILQGTLASDGRMRVSKMTVKCPSKYQEEGLGEDQYNEYYGRKYQTGHPQDEATDRQ